MVRGTNGIIPYFPDPAHSANNSGTYWLSTTTWAERNANAFHFNNNDHSPNIGTVIATPRLNGFKIRCIVGWRSPNAPIPPPHNISVNEQGAGTIPYSGGSRSFVVTSSGAWAATISDSYNLSANGLPALNISSGANGDVITVTFPPQRLDEFGITPTVEITLYLVGTNLRTAFLVSQESRPAVRNLYILSGRSDAQSLSSWNTFPPTPAASIARFGQLRHEISLATNFGGTNAVVRSGARTFSNRLNTAANVPNFPDDMPVADIFVANSTYPDAAGQARIQNWLSANTSGGRVLIITNEDNSPALSGTGGATHAARIQNLLAPFGTYAVGRGQGAPVGHYREIIGNANTSPIHNFLFRDGPFTNGVDISGSVALRPFDRYEGWATAIPATARAIIRCSQDNARILLSICPVHNVVYIGSPSLFGSTGSTGTNWGNAANVAFVRNLAAWIVKAAQHGECFHREVERLFDARP